jgi:hypothetical protein
LIEVRINLVFILLPSADIKVEFSGRDGRR